MTKSTSNIIAATILAAVSSTAFAQTDRNSEIPPSSQMNGSPAGNGAVEKSELKPTNNVSNVVGAFTAIRVNDRLSSRIVGVEVRNKADETIATIEDIAFNESGVDGYILSIGGF